MITKFRFYLFFYFGQVIYTFMQNSPPLIYCYINNFNLAELSRLSNNINLIYRNYNEKYDINTILKLREFSRKTKRKLFLSNNIKLALNLKLDGVYIPSFNKTLNYCYIYNKPQRFEIIGSAHNIREIKLKELQGCNEIFLSPIFKVQKTKEFLDIFKFNFYANQSKKRIIALGGLNENNYKRLRSTNSAGFASISWAKKNGLIKIRPFLKIK